MFYTVCGAFIGGIITYVVCKMRNVSFRSNSNGGPFMLPSDGSFLTGLGVLVGAALGFGYGLHALASGGHFLVNLVKK